MTRGQDFTSRDRAVSAQEGETNEGDQHGDTMGGQPAVQPGNPYLG